MFKIDTEPIFFCDTRKRARRCAAKDHIISTWLKKLDVHNDFHAALMPCLRGPEIELLTARGVPTGNLMAIERDPSTYAAMRQAPYLRGVWMPPAPKDAVDAIDSIAAELWQRGGKQLNLIYLDFFSQPGTEQAEILYKLKRLNLMAPGATLIFNHGNNRTTKTVSQINRALARRFGRIPFKALLKVFSPRRVVAYTERHYYSKTGIAKKRLYVSAKAIFA